MLNARMPRLHGGSARGVGTDSTTFAPAARMGSCANVVTDAKFRTVRYAIMQASVSLNSMGLLRN